MQGAAVHAAAVIASITGSHLRKSDRGTVARSAEARSKDEADVALIVDQTPGVRSSFHRRPLPPHRWPSWKEFWAHPPEGLSAVAEPAPLGQLLETMRQGSLVPTIRVR